MAFDSVDFDLWMDIQGQRVPLTGFSTSYALNSIPTAVVTLPVGIRHDTLTESASHEIFRRFGQNMVPAQVWVRTVRRPGVEFVGPTPGSGDILLFDGWVTVPGYRRSTASFGLSLTMVHWLDMLNATSTLSESVYPGSPLNFTFNSVVDGRHPAGGDWTPTTQAQKTLSSDALQRDLWTNAILPWFKELASRDKLQFEEFGVPSPVGAQDRVLAMLDRLSVDSRAPLTLDAGSGNRGRQVGTEMIDNIRKEIADVTYSATSASNAIPSMAQTTFWNKIAGQLGPLFQFSLVPRPSDALIVPFVPGLRQYHNPHGEQATLWSRDLDFIDLGGSLVRPVRGLALFTDSVASVTGLPPRSPGDRGVTLVGAHQETTDGAVIFVRAPSWMSSISASIGEFSKSTLVRGTATKSNPSPSNQQEPGSTPREKAIAAEDYMSTSRSQYARALYVFEALKGRSGQVSGTFRMDICPGSSIRIEGIGRGTPAMHAEVIRVLLDFDADSQRSSTTFQLAHIRTESENQNDATSIDNHPIYSTRWSGAQLISED